MQPDDDYVLTMPRREQERKGKIRCHPSGRYINPLQLKAEDIFIEDIAHHLSNICRYTGASPTFYSVAQHSVLVADELLESGDYLLALAGLLHDSGEYVFNDLASPVKHDPRMAWYSEMEHSATRLIYTVFDLDPDLLPLTKGADDAVFKREVATWWDANCKRPIDTWAPELARERFMDLFNFLRRMQRAAIGI